MGTDTRPDQQRRVPERHRLPFQRPDNWAVEQDPEAVRGWLKETWPAIRATAKAEGAEVLVTHIDQKLNWLLSRV
ncbi:hypothetical protein [Kitasatospora sp. NBC_01302]|uniref:hypothetical protein n=1 Tax=Kitasatospora sp. NBC_01302 TaxID=2903575 RepID=UPI002E0D906C